MDIMIRQLKKNILSFAFMLPLCALAQSPAQLISPDDALARLMEGNVRFVDNKCTHLHQDGARRIETVTGGQHPFASILGCADSRVPLEEIFDQGIGDLFAVRVAGNIANVDEIGTLEYGAMNLGIPIIMVLGHTKCGAVTALVKKSEVTPDIGKIVSNIAPALTKVKKIHPSANADTLITYTVTENVWQAVEDILKNSEEIRKLVKTGKVKIVGAVYDLESGKVASLGTHPETERILASVKPHLSSGTLGK
jgi:carbonic anhydrase